MGDAALGMVCDRLGDTAPRWLVVRNASDPQSNGDLPTSPDVQAMWAVWFYDTYGYLTTISSPIARDCPRNGVSGSTRRLVGW